MRAEGPRLGLPRQGIGQTRDDRGLERAEHAVGILQTHRQDVLTLAGALWLARAGPTS